MSTQTIAEALNAGAGKSVRLTARVKRVFDGKSGQSEKGPWTRQDMEIEDSTGTIKVEWWDFALGKAQLQGQTVILAPGPDGKGCYLKEKPGFNGKPPSFIVSCKGAETVKLGGAVASTQASAGQPAVSAAVVGYAPPPAMKLSDYLETAKRVTYYGANELGLQDAALAAFVNTTMIAISQSRVTVDEDAMNDPHDGFAE